jgi:hypothetical protein
MTRGNSKSFSMAYYGIFVVVEKLERKKNQEFNGNKDQKNKNKNRGDGMLLFNCCANIPATCSMKEMEF